MLGITKLLIGLLFGSVALAWMRAFPSSILAVFLVVAAMGLANASRCWNTWQGLLTASVMVAVHLSTGILLLAFASGWVAYVIASKVHSHVCASNGLPHTTSTKMGRLTAPLGSRGE
jgi:hypothetical protein